MEENQESIHNYNSIKNEIFEDSTVEVRETGYTTDCTDFKVCVNGTVISRGYVQKELCDVEKEQESIHNYNSIKNENADDLTVVTQETNSMTGCIDDKVDVYETVISCGCITQEPCDVEKKLGVVEETKIIEDLTIAKGETRHISNINGNYHTYCKGCGEEYDLYCLKCHLATHEDVKPYYCHTSGELFQTKETLYDHVRNVHDEKKKKYKCRKCDFETIYPRNMKEHISTVHSGIKQFKCPRCAFKTSRRKIIDGHLRRHKDTKPIKCESCDIEFGEVQSFVRHRKEVHAIGNKIYSFACTHCEYKATTNSKLKQHVVVHNDDKPFACSLCSYKTKTNLNLKRHVTVIHNDDKPFGCKQCPFKTKTKWQLKLHIAVHSDDKSFACTLCPYKTKINSQLRQHVIIHNEDKPFACAQCPYKAKTHSHLKRHAINHNEDKPFACIHCSYKTKTNQQLRQHIVIHNADKPFRCVQCQFKTKTQWQLKLHVAVHSDGKPFACTQCPYKTKTNAQLRQHLAIHNDEKFLACIFCPYKTKTDVQLRQHIVSHNDDISFACGHCSYKTKTKSHLKRHVVIHSDDKPFACTQLPV